MTKFHMSDNGPKPCSASVRECPVGGEHGTQEEIQASYDKKMSDEYSIPTVTKSDFSRENRHIFKLNTKYDDGHQVKIRDAFEAFKGLHANGPDIELEEGDYPYEVTAFYNSEAQALQSGDNEVLGFDANDKIRPFVDMSSKRNIVWMTPGIEVNGEKRYDTKSRYEVADGEDLKKVFDISQESVERLVWGCVEREQEIASELTDTPSDDVIFAGPVKPIRVQLM
jgi:hypothetical protein